MIDIGNPASAGSRDSRTFGTASVRHITPQDMFELVRAHAAAQTGMGVAVRRPAAKPAANDNRGSSSSSAA